MWIVTLNFKPARLGDLEDAEGNHSFDVFEDQYLCAPTLKQVKKLYSYYFGSWDERPEEVQLQNVVVAGEEANNK